MYIEKPDPTKPVFDIFPGAKSAVQQKECPMCGKIINTSDEFRDELSRKEYSISGLCQNCQDAVFGA